MIRRGKYKRLVLMNGNQALWQKGYRQYYRTWTSKDSWSVFWGWISGLALVSVPVHFVLSVLGVIG